MASALGCIGSVGLLGLGGTFMIALLSLLFAGVGYWYFAKDLPTVDDLRNYEPPTVTVLEDVNGVVLGEIYEQRRYVVPMEDIPDHVRNAFLAAEDANFYQHGGVDYMGIVRAFLRNAVKGKMAQGASTITQQVARNFLLTRDKTIVRKVKEIILSAGGSSRHTTKSTSCICTSTRSSWARSRTVVEAASRTFFGKHATEVTLAEAAHAGRSASRAECVQSLQELG